MPLNSHRATLLFSATADKHNVLPPDNITEDTSAVLAKHIELDNITKDNITDDTMVSVAKHIVLSPDNITEDTLASVAKYIVPLIKSFS